MSEQIYSSDIGLTNEMLEKFMKTSTKEKDGLVFMVCDLHYKINRILQLLEQANHSSNSSNDRRDGSNNGENQYGGGKGK